MRIIAGKWGGRRLQVPPGTDTRPTGDRVREALFSSLHSRLGSFDGLRVLDAFAGSGALGLESLSRGAIFLAAIEHNSKACRIIEHNYESLQGEKPCFKSGGFRLYRGDAFKLATSLQDLAIDVAFFDPPYDLPDGKLRELLDVLCQAKAFSYGALIVIERSKNAQEDDMLPSGFSLLDVKKKGDTNLYFVRHDIPTIPPG